MNEYSIFFNGITWTCEVENEDDETICHAIGNCPVEALESAIAIEKDEL